MDSQKDTSALMSLIQTVAYRCPDRTEYRVNVSITIGLMLRIEALSVEHRKVVLKFSYAFHMFLGVFKFSLCFWLNAKAV